MVGYGHWYMSLTTSEITTGSHCIRMVVTEKSLHFK